MAWRGIPFTVSGSESIPQTFLNINHIPEIIIQSGFSWDSLISGLVAGAIPAIVAVMAIKSNSKNIQEERRHQLLLADKNVTAQIVSASRQVWINELREAAASYVGAVTATVNALNLMAIEVREGRSHSEFYIKNLNEQLSAKTELGLLTSKISLLLNPEEESSVMITDALENIRKYILKDRGAMEFLSFEELEPLGMELRQRIYFVVKKEWNKLKNVTN